MRWILPASVALLSLMVFSSGAQAEAGGKGLGRSLSRVGNGAAAPGLERAGKNVPRVGSRLGNANGLNRMAGLPKGPLAKSAGTEIVDAPQDATARHQRQLLNEQRHRDHKLAQALKLRELAERNGDANLAANADRMEAQALAHYEERVAHLGKFGVTDPALNPPVVEAPVEEAPTGEVELTAPAVEAGAEIVVEAPVPATTSAADAPRTASRPWWKPKWWGTR